MLEIIYIVIGFTLLIKGADMLVDGASAVAKKFNISEIVIGLTIVAFGTSAPEFMVNMLASLSGNTDIAIANILGSNIANIFLILGISGLIYPLTVKESTTWKEIPLSLLAALLVGFMANDVLLDGAQSSALTRIDGLVLLSFFIIFLYYITSIAREVGGHDNDGKGTDGILRPFLFIVTGLTGLVIGGKLVVDGSVSAAAAWGISQNLIGLTIVAVGTSLPELFTSVVAAYKNKPDIAIGNIVGSNIFNIFWILGLSAIIKPLPFSPANNSDIGAAILGSAMLFVFMFIGKRHVLERWQSGILLAVYVGYIYSIILRG